MWARRWVSGVLVLLLCLSFSQASKAELLSFEPVPFGAILKGKGIDDSFASTSATAAGPASNPASFIPTVGGSNWVFQFDLSKFPSVDDITEAMFIVTVEGNDDPDLKFGYAHGGTTDGVIDAGDLMAPGPLTTAAVGALGVDFSVDITTEVKDAIDDGDTFFRFALTANPETTELFTAASFYSPYMDVTTVPEPSTFALFGMGVLFLGVRRFRRRG